MRREGLDTPNHKCHVQFDRPDLNYNKIISAFAKPVALSTY